eukprot:XP_001689565.1 predicted protein [Chlamydomonas reinhardtii]
MITLYQHIMWYACAGPYEPFRLKCKPSSILLHTILTILTILVLGRSRFRVRLIQSRPFPSAVQ